MRGLYVHIPFCVSKCSYCDFYSLPSRQDCIEAYVQALLIEAQQHYLSFSAKAGNPLRNPLPSRLFRPAQNDGGYSFQTLYIGGGTPSLLGAKHLKTLMERLKDLCSSPLEGEDSGEGKSLIASPPHSSSLPRGEERTERNIEATIEANPESTTHDFLTTAKESGITRVSFGVQSLSDEELKSVGRIHTASQAIQAIKLAREVGFKSISADLIIGLPGQTWRSLKNSLKTLTGMGIQHLSVYCLSIEEGTPLAKNPPNNLPSDDVQAELFERAREFLKKFGFAHYEISNFALKGFECQHNLNYWHGGEYLGLGPAAASHLGGKRFKNKADLDKYLSNPGEQIEYIEELAPEQKASEEAMLRLRLLEEGLDPGDLVAKFGNEPVNKIITRVDQMVSEGMLIHEGLVYRLNPSRVLTSNPIFARVLSPQ